MLNKLCSFKITIDSLSVDIVSEWMHQYNICHSKVDDISLDKMDHNNRQIVYRCMAERDDAKHFLDLVAKSKTVKASMIWISRG